MSMFQKVSLIGSLLAVLLVAFQNCGSKLSSGAQSSGVTPTPSKNETVIGSTSAIKSVIFSPELYLTFTGGGSASLASSVRIDLLQGTLVLSTGGRSSTCAVDVSRLDSLRAILASAQICQPAPPPPGSVACLAFSSPDIELSDGSKTVLLSPYVCGSGTFLCNNEDGAFRTLLTDLLNTPPDGCK